VTQTINWVLTVILAILGLFGLVLASRAQDMAFSSFGLLLFVFAVLFIFGMVKRAADAAEARGGRP
jgi:hypothetical protein